VRPWAHIRPGNTPDAKVMLGVLSFSRAFQKNHTYPEIAMPGLLPNVDPDGLLEFSVVYTDRALNHMSKRFQGVMKDISGILKEVYHARSAVLVPGSGTFGMEAVARQFATGKKTLVIRNGWFSYRWTQIFDMGNIPAESTVLKARRIGGGSQASWIPCPVEEVVATIKAKRPDVVLLSERARAAIESTTSTSFAADLKKWLQVMEAYENGGHTYHTTMPTDALARLDEVMRETKLYGFEKVRQEQIALGAKVRALLESRGFVSVAAEGFKAPGVVVSYTTDPEVQNSKKFLGLGLQTAAGVPLQCDEPADFSTFRIGLFGLDKLHQPDRSVKQLSDALDKLGFKDKMPAAA